MSNSYDLTQLDAHSFEHMVNSLALTVLGKGVTGLAQGADGGRDGLLTGEAPYPSEVDRWNGTWYIQSKFHKPHLSRDSQKWLIAEVKSEIKAYLEPSGRVIPDNWIIATNIEPSGTPTTGAYDSIKEAVEEAFGTNVKFDVWGGRKILDFLTQDPQVAAHFGHFLTPGHVLSAMYQQIGDASAQVKPIINHLILDQFKDQVYTKLEQAGGTGPKPKIHELFVDLPAQPKEHQEQVCILETLVSTASNVHKPTAWGRFGDGWRTWAAHPKRARAIILKGGPGQGKSTAGQFFCQIQRAALLLESNSITTLPDVRETAVELLTVASRLNFNPLAPRIPISIELKDFASWHGARKTSESKGVLAYLCEKIASKIDQPVEGGTLKRAFETRSWFVNFDGLDEVPNDVKDQVAEEVIRFVNVILPQLDADVLVLCTTRPQGYSGQFKELNAITLDLIPLPAEIALRCAEGVVRFSAGDSEAQSCMDILQTAIESPQVRELMTTPLQSHIMAVVVKEGGRPPEKRWELFDNFYQVMKRRESLKNFPDARISQMLRENSVLLKAIHSRLGISLHSLAEQSFGAETTLSRDQFESLTRQTTEKYEDDKIDEIVDTLMEATVQRLVFVSTPESSSSVRFDVRQLQEFFAAEFLYSGVSHQQLKSRLDIVGGDSHWREVMHFAISALIVTSRPTELSVAIGCISKLDDSDSSLALRAYNRRIGAGALMTLRLLHEGVLEQDRSIRMQFKDTLSPIYGMMDASVTESLCSVRHPSTLAWLLNCMIDALLELSESEQINAAAVLAQLLPCDHKRRNEVSRKIRSSSPGYLNGLFTIVLGEGNYPFAPANKNYVSKWFTQLTLEFLVAENPPKGFSLNLPLRHARSIINNKSALDDYDFPDDIKSALWVLLDPAWRARERFDAHEECEINGLGMVRRKENWKTGTLPKELDKYIWASSAPAAQIINNIIVFVQERSLEALRRLFEVAIKHDLIELITHSIISHLMPIDTYSMPQDIILSKLSSMSQLDLDLILEHEFQLSSLINPPYELNRYAVAETAEQFITLATVHEKLALASWIGVFDFSEPIMKDNISRLDDAVLQVINTRPYAMLSLFGGWGEVASTQPELFSRIRPLMRETASGVDSLLTPVSIRPFLLEFPADYVFLPHVMKSLLADLRINQAHRESEDRVSAEEILAAYGLDKVKLQDIYDNDERELEYRTAAVGCALLLAVFNNEGSENPILGSITRSLLGLLRENIDSVLIDVVYHAFTGLDFYRTEHKEFVGEVLIICRENYCSRYEMQYVLGFFREYSSAPVSSERVLDAWLLD